MKLLDLKPEGRFVFVGDTHGDLEASKKVIAKYLTQGTKIVFLGDYVDRGPMSVQNVGYLLDVKNKNPETLILLQGNHENFPAYDFHPADFWLQLSSDKKKEYYDIFRKFPLVVSVGNILALHGALPNVTDLKDLEKIREVDANWEAILWGDFYEGKKDYLTTDSGRPLYGQKYFREIMGRLNKEVLIRSHDPMAKEKMFGNRCLTIFTSCAYERRRTLAIADFSRKINSVDDLVIKDIDD